MTPRLRRSHLAALIITLGSAGGAANAAVINLNYDFASFTASFNGVTQATGAMTMTIVVDTSTPNLGGGFGAFSNFYDADVFLTAPDLGLANEQVVTATYLYFGSGVVGFTDTVGNFNTILTSVGSVPLSFGSQFDLSTIVVPQAAASHSSTELRTGNAIVFSNGSLFDVGTFDQFSGSNTVSVTAVPEPGSALLLGLGALGLVARRRRTGV